MSKITLAPARNGIFLPARVNVLGRLVGAGPFKIHFKPLFNLLQPLSRLTLLSIYLFLNITSCNLKPAFCQEINFDRLVPAIIQIESGGDPSAISPQGCIGLMQINPKGALREYCNITGANYDLSFAHLWDSDFNVEVGLWYLKRLYYHYQCRTLEEILAAYNGGITRLRRNNYDIDKMPKETQNYIRKVLEIYNQ